MAGYGMKMNGTCSAMYALTKPTLPSGAITADTGGWPIGEDAFNRSIRYCVIPVVLDW